MSYFLSLLQTLHSDLRALNSNARSRLITSNTAVRSLVARHAILGDTFVKLHGDFEIFVIGGCLGRSRDDRVAIAREFFNIAQLFEKTEAVINSVARSVREAESGEVKSEGGVKIETESNSKGIH